MNWRHRPVTTIVRWLAWMALLTVLPWWLGLPLLLAMSAGVVLFQRRLGLQVDLVRHALRWGLAGLLLSVWRTLGADAFAVGAALLGALAGYTLLAGLDAWLHRDRRGEALHDASAEWPELAMAPIGPPVVIIELQPPHWQPVATGLVDPLGEPPAYADGSFRFADGSILGPASPHAAFSPDGRWFATRTPDDRALLLWDRCEHHRHQLRGRQLCGWHDGQPWLNRREDEVPSPLWSGERGVSEEE